MAMDLGKSGGPKSDINITPLVDVVLVLLIIFMVITPLAQRGYDIEIPKESQQQTPPDTANEVKNVMLAISDQDCQITAPINPGADLPQGCRVRINDDPVSISEFPKRISDIMKARKKAEKVLFLAAQEKLNYEGVVRILDLAKNAVGEDLKIAIVSNEKFATGSVAAAR